jgi:hypothetical protein
MRSKTIDLCHFNIRLFKKSLIPPFLAADPTGPRKEAAKGKGLFDKAAAKNDAVRMLGLALVEVNDVPTMSGKRGSSLSKLRAEAGRTSIR